MTRVELMELALQKRASAPRTNHDQTVKGENQLYPDPPERARDAGTLNAAWGQEAHKDPTHNSTGVWEEYRKAHDNLLRNQFSGFRQASEEAKRTARSVLSRPFEARSPLLKTASLSPTLDEQIKRALG